MRGRVTSRRPAASTSRQASRAGTVPILRRGSGRCRCRDRRRRSAPCCSCATSDSEAPTMVRGHPGGARAPPLLRRVLDAAAVGLRLRARDGLAGEEFVEGGVRIVGLTNLPSTMAYDASRLYSRNVTSLLQHLAPEGELRLDFEGARVDAICKPGHAAPAALALGPARGDGAAALAATRRSRPASRRALRPR